jgi:competence protein ComEA
VTPVTQRLVLAVLVGITAAVTIVFGGYLLLDARDAPPIVFSDPAASATVVVAIDGAVVNPGTYGLPATARVQDAIDAAGGLAPNADVAQFNPAQRLRDEQQIHIPAVATAVAENGGYGVRTAPSAADDGRIDINRATADELDELPGIGPAIAARIVEFREDNGPFGSIDELARVDGISARMVDELRDLITARP